MTKETSSNNLEALDIENILQMLPHRYPMLMIDKVVNIKLGHSALGIKNVTANEQYFVGHFPKKMVMPGVLMIEAMAQTCAVLVIETIGKMAEGSLVYFMSVDGAKFRKPVIPGDQLNIKVSKEQNRGNVWKFNCNCFVEDVKVSEAIITAMISEKNE